MATQTATKPCSRKPAKAPHSCRVVKALLRMGKPEIASVKNAAAA